MFVLRKLTTLTALIFAYLKSLYFCNTSSLKFYNKLQIPSKSLFSVNRDIFLSRQKIIRNGKTFLLGEGLVNRDEFMQTKIFKSAAPGFTFMAHKMPEDIDLKNYWDVFRGYDLPFTEGSSIKHLTIRDRLLLGIDWSSPMEKSLELINFLLMEVFNEGELLRSQKYIEFSYLFISENLEINREGHRNNHLLSNLAALAIFEACCFEGSSWRQKFLDEAAYQFCSDGSNFEGSTSYHFFSTEILLLAYIFLSKPKFLKPILAKALGVCNLLLREDGNIPYIGDNDSGRISKLWVELTPNEETLESFRQFTSNASEICKPKMPKTIICNKNFSDSVNVESSLFRELSFSKIVLTVETDLSEIEIYRLDGLSLYVLKSGGATLTFKVGSLGQKGNGGHDHYDQLSITLIKNETILLDDLGVKRYFGGSDKERGKSISCHNGFIDSRQLKLEQSYGFEHPKLYSEEHILTQNSLAGVLHYENFSVGRKISFKDNQLVVTDFYNDLEFYRDPINNVEVTERFKVYGRPNK